MDAGRYTRMPINDTETRADRDSVSRSWVDAFRGAIGRRMRAQRRSDAGFTMVEVIISLLIIGVVSTASAGFFASNVKDVNGQRQHQEAVDLADQQMETVQSLPVAKLVAGRTHAAVTALFATSAATALSISTQDDVANAGDYDSSGATTPVIAPQLVQTVNNVPYTIYTFIDVCWFAVQTGNCGPTNTTTPVTTKEYRASVYVSWLSSGPCHLGCNYSTSTLIDPTADPTFNTNLSQPSLTTGPTPGTVNNDNGYTDSCTTASGTDVGTEIVLTAANLKSGVRVWISSGGGTISEVSQPNATEVDFCLQAADQPGSYTLSVLNPDGGHFQTSITEVPNIATATGWAPGGTLTLSGGGFESGATLTASSGTSFGATTITAGGGSLDTMTVPSFVGPTNGASSTLTLTNLDGTTATYKIVAPAETSYVSVPQAKTNGAWVNGQTTSLTVTGSGFKAGSGTAISASNGTVSETYVNATTEQVVLSGATPGTDVLRFYNGDGGASSTFTVAVDAAPIVTTQSPGFIVGSTLTTVTLTGTGFQSNMTATQSDPGSIAVSSVSGANSVGTASTIVFRVTDSTNTSDTITLTNPTDGGTTSINLDAAPVVTSRTPTAVNASTATTVTVSGTGFQSNMTVSDTAAGTISVTGVSGANSVGTASTVTLSINATSTGTDTVTLTNPTDGGSTTFTLTVSPTITNLAATGTLTHSQNPTNWTITGTGFVTTGTTTVTLKENGTTIAPTTVVVASATSITFKGTPLATKGSESFVVTVTNPDGTTASFTKTLSVS
jgi:prepilin-type N-terminal cleavage/methylation domain-containing protein